MGRAKCGVSSPAAVGHSHPRPPLLNTPVCAAHLRRRPGRVVVVDGDAQVRQEERQKGQELRELQQQEGARVRLPLDVDDGAHERAAEEVGVGVGRDLFCW